MILSITSSSSKTTDPDSPFSSDVSSPVFHNTFKMFEQVLGYKASEVQMQISFGKGKEEFWSNVFPSELVDHFKEDIKKVSPSNQKAAPSDFLIENQGRPLLHLSYSSGFSFFLFPTFPPVRQSSSNDQEIRSRLCNDSGL